MHTGAPASGPAGPPSPVLRHSRRRTVGGALVLLAAAVLMAGAAGWVSTPAPGRAEQRAAGILSAHHGQDTISLPEPDRIGAAVVATEDSRFYRHHGIDAVGVLRAAVSALSSSADPGGATLDVQLGKVLYGRTAGGPATKVHQFVLGMKLDRQYTKARILELYLNAVYYGHGFYGISAASHGYFGVAPARLTWGQASLLAGLLQAPSGDDPLRHLPRARARQAHVLTRLVETGRLSPDRARAAADEPLHLMSAPSAG